MRISVLAALLGTLLFGGASAQESGYEFRYHTYTESTAILRDLAEAYPSLTEL